jgi:outer membrane lipoprotein-sorting protein
MMKKIFCFLLLVVFAAVTGLSAVSAEDIAGLVEKSNKRFEKFRSSIEDMTLVQEMRSQAPQGEMVSEMSMYLKGDKYRAESVVVNGAMKGARSVIIFDGENGWMISSIAGKTQLPQDQNDMYKPHFNSLELISENARITGSEEVDGKDCYVIENTEKAEFPITKIWLDKEQLIIVKSEANDPSGGKMVFVYSDFRKIKDILEFPFKTEGSKEGKIFTTSVITKLETDSDLSDDLFDPDKVEIKQVDLQDLMKQKNMSAQEQE